MIALAGFVGSFVGLRHALAYAADLRRRCIVNGEAAKDVAVSMGLDVEQTQGTVRLLRAVPTLSPERAALVVMRDWGMTDEDIAEIFGRSERWAAVVRAQADEIRAEEPVPEDLEYLDSGLQKGDPSPDEIAERVRTLERRPRDMAALSPQAAIRAYQWSGHAFLSVSPD